MVLSLQIVDSHTGGEPTRTIVAGGPDIGSGSMAERLTKLQSKHDHLRTALVTEPRGSEVMVGALLCEPQDEENAAGVIFFNNVGYLGMCGHGLIGVAITLHHLGKIGLGKHHVETPVGLVEVELLSPNKASIKNVASYRFAKDVVVNVDVDVDPRGQISGDIAWGGNWFYLVKNHRQKLSIDQCDSLLDYTWSIRQALEQANITGTHGALIDHIELFVEPDSTTLADSINFVLCPGRAYDRSPCGTGTSAKMACLYEDGELTPGQAWRQQSIIGSLFEGSVEIINGQIIPKIIGEAFINLEATVIFDENDPFQYGLGSYKS